MNNDKKNNYYRQNWMIIPDQTGKILIGFHNVYSKISEKRSNRTLALTLLAVAYFITNSVSQYTLSSTANLDQSEQLVFSQALQLGYSSQPPLYTWLIYALFSVTGPSLWALVVFKVLLLSAFVGLLIGLGEQLAFTAKQQLTSLISLAFIPQYIWESQRDITHSVLATVLAAATLLQVMRSRDNPSIANYMIAGVLVALGIISKYNYAVFLLALIITAALSAQYRHVILNCRSLLSLGVAIALVAPHGNWVINNLDMASSSLHKFNVKEGQYLGGMTEVLSSFFTFLTPLWLFGIMLIKDGFQVLNSSQQRERAFITGLLVTTLTLVLLLAVFSGTQNVKVRWYQPLLFYMPLLIALTASPSRKALKIYYSTAVVVLAAVSIAFPLRIVFAHYIGNKARPNLPYLAQAKRLANMIGEPGAIYSETNLIGGNMRLHFKNARIITPEFDRQPFNQMGNTVLLCETKHCQNKTLQEWLLNRHNIDIDLLKFNLIETSYDYIPEQKHIIYWAKVGSVSD